jgi:hypothetical protein
MHMFLEAHISNHSIMAELCRRRPKRKRRKQSLADFKLLTRGCKVLNMTVVVQHSWRLQHLKVGSEIMAVGLSGALL